MTRISMILSAGTLLAGLATLLGAMAWAKPVAERADCPGKIVCPLTGELVCIDRCPVGAQKAGSKESDSPPACCRAEGEKR